MRNLMETNLKTAMAPAMIENCNVMKGNMKSLKTPMGMLLQIELLVIFTAFLLLFLVTCGSWRRRSNNKNLRLIIFTAYTLSTYVITYALGLMQDAPLRSELFPVWAMFLMLALGSADSISAYSLEDNEQWKNYNWQRVIKLIWLVLLMSLYFHSRSEAVVTAECLFIVLVVKSDERARALMAASLHSLQRNTKVVADYMSVEHENGGVPHGVHPVRMRGYTYLVTWEEENWVYEIARAIYRWVWKHEAAQAPNYRMTLDKKKLITIEKVWGCEGRLLSSEGDPQNKLKDICLSFALYKLLRLRYAGYSLPREAHKKTWNLIRRGLLSKEDGYKRAFRVVEVELMFLYDFFYTKYSIIFQPGWLLIKLMEFMYVVMGIWATTSLLTHYKRPNSNCPLATVPNVLSVDVLVTSVMIISFIVVELTQFFFMGFSVWAKVTWICKYVQKRSWQNNAWIERMIGAICRVRLLKPWERKLHQYSILESYFYKSSRLLNNVIMATYIDQDRDGQKQSKPIPLPEKVKQEVFDALKWNYGTKLENGQTSLRVNNESRQLLWACQLETQTQVIMVWHIATSFCEYQLPVGRSDSDATRSSFLVATSLSKYLAYLVAFAPRLLPDHPYVTEYVFDQAIIEARDFFQGCNSLDDRVTKMERKGRGSSAREKTVINRGARLGNQLVNDIKREDMIWRILADFWVELVLYVAPSNDAKAHAEHLTRGGEFLTHLWALLSHAGIERDYPTKPPNALKRSKSF
ncbi:uncharacterized protein LOC115677922 [Syzygium oleosum]|uniref:uncharacterized protein LOC115677922 n=1 Tax=Syzygium oleosum TaxID=219896 RepID=UPI0024BA0229|nr:uncharacterized protein LOC115677922 [Syzygium oleosum]